MTVTNDNQADAPSRKLRDMSAMIADLNAMGVSMTYPGMRQLIKRGKLKPITIGRKYYFHDDQFQSMITNGAKA